jgi:hypothetical protein
MSDQIRKAGRTNQKSGSRGLGPVADSQNIHPSVAGISIVTRMPCHKRDRTYNSPLLQLTPNVAIWRCSRSPQLPFVLFGGGPGSTAGSEYGGLPAGMPQPPYQNTGSVYGKLPNALRDAVMTNMNLSGGDDAIPQFAGAGGHPPYANLLHGYLHQPICWSEYEPRSHRRMTSPMPCVTISAPRI